MKIVLFFALVAILLVSCTAFVIPMKRMAKHSKDELDAIRMSRGLPKNMRIAQNTVPMPGNFSGNAIYYVELEIGTPPHPFTVQVDTGSADLAIPLVGCKCNKHVNPYYNPAESSTSSKVPCNGGSEHLVGCKCRTDQCYYEITYADSSGFSAEMFNDSVKIGNVSTNTLFGGIFYSHDPSGPFEPYLIDGICGFGQKALSVLQANPLPMALAAAGQMDPLFSLCFASDFTGGALSMGEVGSYHTGQVEYTNMLQNEGFYSVWINDFLVEGKSVGVPAKEYNEVPSVVDTGTDGIYIPNKPYAVWEDRMIANCSSNNLAGVCGLEKKNNIFAGYCFSIPEDQIDKWPPVTFILGKNSTDHATITLEGRDYLIQGQCYNPKDYAMAFVNGPASYGSLLGESVMLAYEVVFDFGNQKMGFAKSQNCPSQKPL